MQIVLAIIQHENKVLIVQREKPDSEVSDLKWVFPGGKVESGELIEQALIREVHEETGLRISLDGLIHSRKIPNTEILAHYFLCCLADSNKHEVSLNPLELSAFEWTSGAEALSRFTSNVAEPIKSLLRQMG